MVQKHARHIILLVLLPLYILMAGSIPAATYASSAESAIRRVVVAVSSDLGPFHFIDESGQPAETETASQAQPP